MTVFAEGLNGANTSWILISTALVLLMILPSLALFYGGLIRTKNILSVPMQCFAIAGIVSILWLVAGYSIAFAEGNAYFGGLSKFMLAGVTEDSLSGDIPENLFALFQMTFAIITLALIIGGFAERMKFSAVLLFSAIWLIMVYAPITRWVWGGGVIGTLMAAVFASNELGILSGQGLAEGMTIMSQLEVQVIGVVAIFVYTAVATYIILKVVEMITSLRVRAEEEQQGLDLISHNEKRLRFVS
ncbi:MAG TPA: hypothetical protein EYJ00_01425 [Gammaproteobacteria bacterium]|nr:hypothetical protein [Gammaproteobacteria bacterium]